MRSIPLALGMMIAFAAPLSGADANWPRWRGAQQDGHSDDSGLPTRWSNTNVVWKTTLPGIGQSTPIIWGDRIFLTSALTQGQERLVLCVDRRSGKLLW